MSRSARLGDRQRSVIDQARRAPPRRARAPSPSDGAARLRRSGVPSAWSNIGANAPRRPSGPGSVTPDRGNCPDPDAGRTGLGSQAEAYIRTPRPVHARRSPSKCTSHPPRNARPPRFESPPPTGRDGRRTLTVPPWHRPLRAGQALLREVSDRVIHRYRRGLQRSSMAVTRRISVFLHIFSPQPWIKL